jgi:hypothetical protein
VPFGPRSSRPSQPGRPKPSGERLLHGRDGDVHVYWAAEDPNRPFLRTVATAPQALAYLKATRDPAATAETLRLFWKAKWTSALEATPGESRKTIFDVVYGVGRPDAKGVEAILSIAAAQLASGKVRLARVEVVSGAGGTPEVEKKAVMQSSGRTKLTWIAIELVDDDDQPVAGEAYEVTLPDGSVRSGSLDGDGKAEERGIDEGMCKVTFPKLDADAWEFVETRS